MKQTLGSPQAYSKPFRDFFDWRMNVCNLKNKFLKFIVRVAFEARQYVCAAVNEKVQNQESGSLIAVSEAVISGQGLRKRCGLLMDAPVVARIGSSDRGLNRGNIANSSNAAVRQRNLMGFYDVAQCDSVVAVDLALCQSPKGVGRHYCSFAETSFRLRTGSGGVSVAWQRDALTLCSARSTSRLSNWDKLAAFAVATAYAGFRLVLVTGHGPIIGPGPELDLRGVVLRGRGQGEAPGVLVRPGRFIWH